MNGAESISIWGLLTGYGLLLIPLAILLWLKVPMINQLLVGAVRMTVQLLLVGLYLQFVFEKNWAWLNGLWIMFMIFVADLSIVRGTNLRFRKLALPLFIALLAGTAIPMFYFVGLILHRSNLLEARFVIPIGGMILGNCLRADIIGVRRFYHSIRQNEKSFHQQLADGASLAEATRPWLRYAMTEALSPTLATMATVGLVSLPGMMTGVILGGSDPRTAVMYQIGIMIAIFSGTAITIFLGIILTRKVSFDAYGLLNKDIFK